jgi:heme/copper-type cytochrome/quinol oxidase subunit 2
MKSIKKIYFGFIAIILSLPTNIVFADVFFGRDGSSGTLQNPLKEGYTSIPDFLGALLDIVITIAIPIIVLMIIYSGFLFVKAQGKPEELVTARKAIVWTLIGAAIILGASLLSYAIQGTIEEIRRDIVQSSYIIELT